MRLQAYRVKNYRRLRNVLIELDADSTIFVGANNSGKTAASKVLEVFLGKAPGRDVSIHDFSADCWPIFDALGSGEHERSVHPPTISLDIWFAVEANDVFRVLKILPSLAWEGTPVGVRLEFAPKDWGELFANFQAAKAAADENIQRDGSGEVDYRPWPESLSKYLEKRLSEEYAIRYFVLDYQQFDESYSERTTTYRPAKLGDAGESGAAIVRSLLQIDFVGAQRHLSDETKKQAENLSERLSEFYQRNLQKYDSDFKALAALAKSEQEFNKHLEVVFGSTLAGLNTLGYPGLSEPHLTILSAFKAQEMLHKNTSVHYTLREPGSTPSDQMPMLPEKYNGLGFKNLIFMVVEVLDYHHRWAEAKDKRPPLHLVVIEEPEAHLHAQLQQVFIRKILEILPKESPLFETQLLITTHSPHIIYESNFKPIRYFKRDTAGSRSSVLNLSTFYRDKSETSDFLLRYMKLTHCDLFFADAAILVEGNVERLLIPLMIGESAPNLNSVYLSIHEVGGAFAYKFRELVHFLGLTTLVITDIDSVRQQVTSPPKEGVAPGTGAAASLDPDEEESSRPSSCMTNAHGAVTTNQTLIQWLPGDPVVSNLLAFGDERKCSVHSLTEPARVRVAYQTAVNVEWSGKSALIAGRTLEEAFAFENLAWSQDAARESLGLRIKSKTPIELDTLLERIHKRVGSTSFKKTEFALQLLMMQPGWSPPEYIASGLKWLEAEVTPRRSTNTAAGAAASENTLTNGELSAT
jgi:predicted ATP-dependent endonuclease of OLD family